MNNVAQYIILDALNIKEASIKRGINTTKNPKFKAVYDEELRDLHKARTLFEELCIQWNTPEPPKK